MHLVQPGKNSGQGWQMQAMRETGKRAEATGIKFKNEVVQDLRKSKSVYPRDVRYLL